MHRPRNDAAGIDDCPSLGVGAAMDGTVNLQAGACLDTSTSEYF